MLQMQLMSLLQDEHFRGAPRKKKKKKKKKKKAACKIQQEAKLMTQTLAPEFYAPPVRPPTPLEGGLLWSGRLLERPQQRPW